MATTTVFHSIRREEQDKLARKRFLQRLLHDDSKSIIERTKARVELALLTSDAAADQHADDDDDIHQIMDDTIKHHTGLVSRIAAERERDIQRNAERQRREEIILRLIAQLKEQGAIMSEARRLRLEKELEQAVEDMEQWEKDNEDAKENEGEVANKEVFSSEHNTPPMIRRASNGSCSEEKKDDSSFLEQLTSFREEQQQMRNITLPPSFYKSSPSLLGGVVAPEEAHPQGGHGEEEETNKNKKTPAHHRSKEISSDSWERRQTHDTADTLSVESDSTASTVEITNVPMGGESSPNPPPHGSKEISDCWPTPDTADTSSVQSDSSESTVEINNASSSMRLVGGDCPNRTASLERQIQMLLKEAELREESMQMMAMELEQTQRKNEKRIDKLKSHLVKVSKELEDYPRQLQYWKEKSLELSKKVYTLEVELDEKEESIEDLVEYKYSQDVKIDSLEREVETLRLERRRDRAEEVVDKLLVPPKREITRSASASMMDMAIDTTMNSCVSIATTEETASDDLRRLEESFRKDEEQTKVDVSALEVRVARIAQEKAEMQAELEEMRLLLAEASAKAEERKEQRKKKKKSTTNKGPSQLIYQVSCRKCPKGKNCAVVGVTTEDLKSKVLALAKQSVVTAASSGKKTGRLINPSSFTGLKLDTSSFNLGSLLLDNNNHSSSNCSVGDSSRLTEETTNEDAFIQHLASHIPKKVAKNEKEALSFCKKIVKVEVLKKETGEELYWHDSIEE